MIPRRDLRALVLAFAAVLSGCSVLTDFSADRFLERTEALCADNIDNDSNDLTDCADPSCKQFEFCMENAATRCADNRDNDTDGLVDCQDPQCCAFAQCAMAPGCAEQTDTACSDGLDNDSNGLTDCADFSCAGPRCCRRPLPLMVETFDAFSTTCNPPDCATQPEQCCISDIASCNVFDNGRWTAWGLPAPRILDNAFTPNQPCAACPVSGLLSVVDTSLSPGLLLEFEADLEGAPDAWLSVGFVERVTIPNTNLPCSSIMAPFPLLAGINLDGSQVQVEVGGILRTAHAGRTTGPQRLGITVNEIGTIEFRYDDMLFFTTAIRVQEPYPRVRLLVQGHSALATIDNILLARRAGCATPQSWVPGPTGSGPVIVPGQSFDSSSVADPSVILDGNTYRIYYTGRSAETDGSQLGMATSNDGQTWNTPGTLITIHGETSDRLSDPEVLKLDQEYIMAYRRVSGSGKPSIAIGTSADGLTWNRGPTAVTVGPSESWDGGDIDAPALLWFRNRLFLWYAGRDQKSAVSGLGLATSTDKMEFIKSPFNPVLTASIGNLDDRGITDPCMIIEDNVLKMWYVGLTWGGRSSINYAVSEDGRNWVRYSNNPVIRAGDPNLFGGADFRGPTVLDRWGTLHMWYGGVDPSGLPSIGYATSVSIATFQPAASP